MRFRPGEKSRAAGRATRETRRGEARRARTGAKNRGRYSRSGGKGKEKNGIGREIHRPREDEKGDSRDEERLSATWKSGMGAWVEWARGGDERSTGAPLQARRWWGQFRAAVRGAASAAWLGRRRRGRTGRGRLCRGGGGRGGEDDRGAVSAPRAAVAGGSLLSLRSAGGHVTARSTFVPDGDLVLADVVVDVGVDGCASRRSVRTW